VSVRKGEEWGVEGVVPDGLEIATSDADLQRILTRILDRTSTRRDDDRPTVGLVGGDLWRTVGGTPGRSGLVAGATAALLTIDLGLVTVGDRDVPFAGHLIARRSWWRGEVLAVMNAQFLGGWDVAPRSHPNDGRLDVLRVRPTMSIGDRWKARARLPSGTHVPHPLVEQSRVAQLDVRFARPLDVVVDGVPLGRYDRLAVAVLPDALTIVI